jgi:hypothetical protein
MYLNGLGLLFSFVAFFAGPVCESAVPLLC